MELAYLHEDIFKPDIKIFSDLGIDIGTPYIVIRLVSWDAAHDLGQNGISREMLSLMQPKSILSDVAIDQGGCFETSKVTSHSEPTYEVDDIIHYCVRNIPSAVPFTATNALNESTRPFIARLANDGVEGLKSNTNLLMALNTHQGHLVNQEVADAHDLKYSNPSNIL